MNYSYPDILLFGMPRSGTTWIGKVFDSHPDVSYRHEPDSEFSMKEILPLYPDINDGKKCQDQILAYCERHLHLCSTRICGKSPIFKKDALSSTGAARQKGMILIARLSERLLGKNLVWKDKARSSKLVWKSIESLGRMGILLSSLPGCKGIIIQRDPCGYAASVLRGEKMGRFSAAGSITEDWNLFELLLATPYARQLGLGIGQIKSASPVERLAWLWVLNNQKACDDTAGLENACIVRYEDLCRSPQQGFKQLFDFSGLEWNAQTEQFLAFSTGEKHSDSYYSVRKDPLKAAYQWKKELSEDQIKTIQKLASAHPAGQAYYGSDSHYKFISC